MTVVGNSAELNTEMVLKHLPLQIYEIVFCPVMKMIIGFYAIKHKQMFVFM